MYENKIKLDLKIVEASYKIFDYLKQDIPTCIKFVTKPLTKLYLKAR